MGLEMSQVNPAQLAPPPGMVTAMNGQSLLVASPSQVFWLMNFITLKKPQFRGVSPSDLGSYAIQAVAISPFFTRTAIPAYVLAYDSGNDNSAVWYTPNVAAVVPSWTKGADQAGHFKIVRATNADGTIMIYSPSETTGTTWSQTYDFTVSDWGWTPVITAGFTRARYVAGVGWHRGYDTADYSDRVSIQKTLPSHTITHERVYVDSCTGVSSIGMWNSTAVYPPCSGGYADYTHTAATFTDEVIDVVFSNVYDPYVTSVLFEGTGSNPLGGNGNGSAVKSTDNGATWGTPQATGVTPGVVGGFAEQRAGTVTYASAAGKVRKATTLGGAYSDWYSVPSAVNPVCLVQPYFRRNSTTRITAASDPDVIAACANGKLYWIDGTAATATDITPTGMTEFDNANCVTVSYGHHLAVFGKVSGTYHLFTSKDGGANWTDRGSLTSPTFIRDRRNDDRASASGTDKGQLFLTSGSPSTVGYSSTWASGGGSVAGLFPRTCPVSDISMLEAIY